MSDTPYESLSPMGRVKRLTVKTVEEWLGDDGMRWGAAIAFYAVTSMGPLVVLAGTILGRVLGSGAAEERILSQVRLLAGPRGAEVAAMLLERAEGPDFTSLGALVTVALLLFGATAVFANIQGALNAIWSVEPRRGTVGNLVRTRIAAFLMLLALAGLMLVSLVVGTLVGWVGPLVDPLTAWLPLVRILDALTSLFLLWLFVTAAFQVLPDVTISWRDVRVGALVTAILLVLGKSAIAAFLARNAFGSLYGAAGSVFLLLLWVYYSAHAFLLGAEFTQVRARELGRAIEPSEHAVKVEKRTVEPSFG